MQFLATFGYVCAALGIITLVGSWFQKQQNPKLIWAWRSFIGLAGVAFLIRALAG